MVDAFYSIGIVHTSHFIVSCVSCHLSEAILLFQISFCSMPCHNAINMMAVQVAIRTCFKCHIIKQIHFKELQKAVSFQFKATIVHFGPMVSDLENQAALISLPVQYVQRLLDQQRGIKFIQMFSFSLLFVSMDVVSDHAN